MEIKFATFGLATELRGQVVFQCRCDLYIQVLYTGEIDKGVQKNVPRFLVALHDNTYNLEMVHSYGLFRRYSA